MVAQCCIITNKFDDKGAKLISCKCASNWSIYISSFGPSSPIVDPVAQAAQRLAACHLAPGALQAAASKGAMAPCQLETATIGCHVLQENATHVSACIYDM